MLGFFIFNNCKSYNYIHPPGPSLFLVSFDEEKEGNFGQFKNEIFVSVKEQV